MFFTYTDTIQWLSTYEKRHGMLIFIVFKLASGFNLPPSSLLSSLLSFLPLFPLLLPPSLFKIRSGKVVLVGTWTCPLTA